MSKKLLITIIVLLVTTVGLGVGVYLSQQSQILEPQAAVPDGIISATVEPISRTVQAGDTIDMIVDIGFRPGVESIPINSIGIELVYSYTGSPPPLISSNSDIIFLVGPAGNWNFNAVSDKYVASDGVARIRLVALSQGGSGYLIPNGQRVPYARVRFTAISEGTITITMDTVESKVRLMGSNMNDVLFDQMTPAIYTVSGATVTNTPTPTLGTGQPTATPTLGTGQPTATPTLASGGGNPTATPTQAQSGGNPTATPTQGQSGGGNPTATPTTAGGGNVGAGIVITYPTNGQSISVFQPTIRGTAPSGTVLSFSMSPSGLTGTATADSSGNWSWTVPSQLTGGSHTLSVNGGGLSASRTFTITTATGETSMPQAGSVSHLVIMLTTALLLIGSGVVISRRS